MEGAKVNVNAETAGERAYRRIRHDILFGRLAPAQKLKLDGLKESYSVSVSTLRELLNRLTSEGLIVAEGARGFEVAPISTENLKEVANLRQLLECHAMELSFAAGDMEWEGRGVAAHHKLAMIENRMLAVVFRGEIAAREHRQLLDCALRRDAKSAQGVLIKHIQDCVSYTLANWPSELRVHGSAPALRQAKTSRRYAASA